MKSYTINKTVQAAQIVGIESTFRGLAGTEYQILLEDGTRQQVSPEWLQANNPEITGYLVKADADRLVCIPKATFEQDFKADDGSEFPKVQTVANDKEAEVTERIGEVGNVVSMRKPKGEAEPKQEANHKLGDDSELPTDPSDPKRA